MNNPHHHPPDSPAVPPLLTPRDVSGILGVPINTLYGWHSRCAASEQVGPLALRVGRHLRYSAEDLVTYIDQLRGDAS